MDKRITERYIRQVDAIQDTIEDPETTNVEMLDAISERIGLVDEILFLSEDDEEMDELFAFRKVMSNLRDLFVTIIKIEKGTVW